MALLSFVESAPRAYRLKVSNAALSISTSGGTIPASVAAQRNIQHTMCYTELAPTRFKTFWPD